MCDRAERFNHTQNQARIEERVLFVDELGQAKQNVGQSINWRVDLVWLQG